MQSLIVVWLCILGFLYHAIALEFSLATPTWTTDYQVPRDTWTGLRVVPYFVPTRASDASISELRTDIVPTVARWFGRVLKVPRLNISLKVPITYCGPVDVPPEHQTTGVDGDVVLYIHPAPYQYHPYDKRSYGSACLLNSIAPYRVLAGVVWVQVDWFNGLSHNRKVDLVAQHFAQALGFDSLLFQHFTRSNGYRYEENELHATVTMTGVLRHVLTLPTVVQKARLAFNCPSLKGVRLSGDETDDTRSRFYEDNYDAYKRNFTQYLSLWSGRMMLNDFMSDLIVSGSAEYSDVTMAVFKDSGWYEVDFNYTAPPRFGYKRGCSFFSGHCSVSYVPAFPEFCQPQRQACSSDYTAKGVCSLTSYGSPIPDPFKYYGWYEGGSVNADYCPIVVKGESCLEGDAEVAWEDKCADCRCFQGEYKPETSTAVARNTHCQRVTCALGKASVTIAGQTILCPVEGGTVTIPGFSGSILCPSVDRICKPTPCKNLCSGRGKCENGACTCDSGYYGEDCALVCHHSCKTCVSGSQVKCASCRAGAKLSSGKCACSSPFLMNVVGECVSLTACHPTCVSCFAPDANSCRTCRSPAVLSANACTCPNYMTMSPEGECVSCENECMRCSYSDLKTCLSTRKLSTCASGEFLNAESGRCESCFPPCTTCIDASTSCLSCLDGYTYSDSQCTCPPGRVEIEGQCVPCHGNCLTCIGVEDTVCTSCRSDALLKSRPGACVCRNSSSLNCAACDPECLTCSTADPFQCESCKDNASVDPFTRRCLCNDGYYIDTVLVTCLPCHQSCATCSGPTPNHCNSCTSDYDSLNYHACFCNPRRYLDWVQMKCMDCIAHCALCSSQSCDLCDTGFARSPTGECEVPLGFYLDEVDNKVVSCPSHCAHCEFSERPTLVCLDCKATFHFDDNNNCVCDMGKGVPYWQEACEVCRDPNCASCDSSLYCNQCLPTYQLTCNSYWGCYLSCFCPYGTYEINHSCQACIAPCVQCTGERQCLECRASYYLALLDSGDRVCSPCHAWCDSCYGPNYDQCYSCWPYSSMLEAYKCYCNEGTSEQTCLRCAENCTFCTGPGEFECTACKSNFFLSSLETGERFCVLCHAWCLSCSGLNNDQCTKCWPYSAMLEPGKCYCNDGVPEQTCWRCAEPCERCTVPEGSECTRCKETYYIDPDTKTCSPCHSWCRNCSGPNNDQCTSCWERTAWLRESGRCLCYESVTEEVCWHCPSEFCALCTGADLSECQSCYTAYYLDENKTCKRCNPWCYNCSGPNLDQCTGCWWFASMREQGKCYCNDGTEEQVCFRCAANCYLCDGPAELECRECKQSFYMNTDEGGHVCSPCHPWCRNCNGPNNDQCTSCWEWAAWLGEGGRCFCYEGVTENVCWHCPEGCASCNGLQCRYCYQEYYFDENKACKHCHPWCQSCNGPNFNQCTNCRLWVSSMLEPGKCYCDRGTGDECLHCVEGCQYCNGPGELECTLCKQSFYMSAVEGGQVCSPCHSWCRNCNGPNNDQCTQCWWEYSSFIEGEPGKCYCNFRATQTTCWHSEARDLCHQYCRTCHGPMYYQCETCYDTGVLKRHYSLYDHTCECLPGQESSGTCWPCSHECETCGLNRSCQSCFSWLPFSETKPGTCVCVSGYYPSPDVYNCQRCHQSCLQCAGPEPNQCTACEAHLDLMPEGDCRCKAMATKTPWGSCFARDFFCADDYCDTCRSPAVRTYLYIYGREVGKCACPQRTSLGTGIYEDTMAGICHKCGPLCLNCARDTRICWDCKVHSHLSYVSPLGAPGFCECDLGYFPSYEYEECLLCPPGCTGCKSDTDCTACEYGYELISSNGTAQCQCFSSFCKCPVGLNAILPFDFCEEICHTGFDPIDRVCVTNGNTKSVFRPISIQSDILDQTERFRATFGDPNTEVEEDLASPIPIYQNGLLFKSGRSARITIAGISETLILGPEHYIELWEKGPSLLSIRRGGDTPAFVYRADGMNIKLTKKDAGGNSYQFSFPPVDATTWVLIRYDIQAYKYRLGTRIRTYRNNIQTSENVVPDYYYRDDAFDGGNVDITIWTDGEMLLGDFIIANRLWEAELTTPCACPHCTIAGSCLSDCGPMEFMKADQSCGQCDASCTFGCVRGNDCSRNIDPLCVSFTNFTGCSGCKDMTTFDSGVCSCIEFATLQPNNTCGCGVHGRFVSGVCEFVPDPMCRNYTAPPNCAACVPLAEVVNDFCTCTPHSTYLASSDSCKCDPHYLSNDTRCVFDPLCNTAVGDVCTECKLRATYDGSFCKCIETASSSTDLTSCLCNQGLKPFESKCIPQFDPLCATELDGVCSQCKELAVRVEGICECSTGTHYDAVSQSCLCPDGLALQNGNCVASTDPLCANLFANGTCATCKGLAALSGTACHCVTDTILSADGHSCTCNAGMKPFENRCITASDPLCVQLSGYLCLSCAPLSHLVDGLCQCVEHSSFLSGKCTCEPMFAEYQDTCYETTDPLCTKLALPEVCELCKPLTTLEYGLCSCTLHAHFLDTSNTCACDRHYAESGSTCEFIPDALCTSHDDSGDCTQCKPHSVAQDGVCACVSHASAWKQSDLCDCDYHYTERGNDCEYEPDMLCATYDSTGRCSQCKSAASYQNGACTCGANSVLAADERSCECLANFKVYQTKCIPIDDPLCTNLDGDLCTDCAALSTLIEGVCTCIESAHYSSTTKTCECPSGFAPSGGKCVSTADPLCKQLNSDGKCASCKPQAAFSGSACACVSHSTFIASNSTCQCNARYLPTSAGCELDRDPLCTSYNANDQCTSCKALSAFQNGLCKCVEHASTAQPGACTCEPHYIARDTQNKCEFDPDPLCLDTQSTCRTCKPHSTLKGVYCRCDDGYSLKADTSTCEMCGVYLIPTDVVAEISADFTQLVVYFSGPVNMNITCQAIFFSSTFAKFGSKPACGWNIDRSLLLIQLDADSTVIDEELEFNATTTIKFSRACSYQASNFKVKATYKGRKTAVTGVLKAPSFVPLGCSNYALQIDSKGTLGGVGKPLKFKWELVHSAGIALKNDYHTFSAKDFITLSTKDLQPGTLFVTMTVRDRLGQEDVKKCSIELAQESKLSVDLDVGKSINITSNSRANVRAIVDNTCGQSGQKTYTWSYQGVSRQLSETDKNPAGVLSTSKIPSTMIIDKGALTPGSYIYEVKVTQGTLSGSTLLTVNVLPSPLSVRLNRVSGKHPRDVRFALSAAGSSDPDSMPGDITFEWKCLENNNECKDESGSPLLRAATKADIAIEADKLRLDSVLNFTVTIRKDSRVTSSSVSFTVIEPTGITVLLGPFFSKIFRHLYFAVVPKIETRYQTFFSWKQLSNVTAVSDSPADASYLAFFANRLTPGTLYHFEMTAATLVGTMKQMASFYVISEPQQGYVTVDPVSGREVIDRFYFSTSGWMDPDGNYPLSYQFCAQLSATVEVCVCPRQYYAWSSAKLTAGTYPIVAKVQNSLGGIGRSSSSPVTVEDLEFYRRLVDISVQDSFLADIEEDPETTLGTVAIYSRSLSLDQQLYSLILSTLTQNLGILFEIDLEHFETFLGAGESLIAQNSSREATNAEKLLTLTSQTMARYDSELNEEHLSRVLGIASALSASAPEAASAVMASAIAQFYRNRYPSASPFTFSTSTLQFLSVRQLVQSVTAQTLKIGSVNVVIPNQWLNNTNLTSLDVIDVQFTVSPGNFSQIVTVALSKSGEYNGYNLEFQNTVPVSLFNATAPFNITLTGINAAGVECVGLDASGQWNTALCAIVANKSKVFTVSARSATTYSLRPIATSQPLPGEGPVSTSATSGEGSEESINPAPLALGAFVLVACLVAAFVLRKGKPSPATVYSEENIPLPSPKPVHTESEMTKSKSPATTRTLPSPQQEPRESFWSHHAFVYVRLQRSGSSVLLLASLMTTDLLTLGLLYTFGSDADESAEDAGEVFESYSAHDVIYVAIAVVAGTAAYCLCRLAVRALRKKGRIMCVVLVLGEFAGVVAMNVSLGFGPAGRWGLSALWAVLIQLLVVETIKAALVSACLRMTTQSSPTVMVTVSQENRATNQ